MTSRPCFTWTYNSFFYQAYILMRHIFWYEIVRGKILGEQFSIRHTSTYCTRCSKSRLCKIISLNFSVSLDLIDYFFSYDVYLCQVFIYTNKFHKHCSEASPFIEIQKFCLLLISIKILRSVSAFIASISSFILVFNLSISCTFVLKNICFDKSP